MKNIEYKTRTRDAVLRLLTGARDRIQSGWCRGSAAKDSAGVDVSVSSDYATCFCALGAINAVNDKEPSRLGFNDAHRALRDAIETTTGHRSIVDFNDYDARDKRAVVQKFNLAIRIASKLEYYDE